MLKRLSLFVLCYFALNVLKALTLALWPWFEPYKFEGIAAALPLFLSTFLTVGNPYTGFCLSLALSRLSVIAVDFLSSRAVFMLASYVWFPIKRLDLSQWERMIYPLLICLVVLTLLECLGFFKRFRRFGYKRFLKHAERLARRSPDKFILGRLGWWGCFTMTKEERAKHAQIVGPTGSGKTQLILGLTYQDMLRGMPVFLMEAKGDRKDFNAFTALAKRSGRLGDVLYFNPASDSSMTFNPIRPLGTFWDPIFVANQLSRAIGREPGGASDSEYFKSLDFARLVDLAEILISVGEEFTLEDVYLYFDTQEGRERLFDKCRKGRLIDTATGRLGANGGDLSGIVAHLRPWVSGILGRLLNDPQPQITVESIFDKNKLAYFAIPVGYMPLQTNALGRMLISNVLSYAQLRQSGDARQPASVYLDEFTEFVTPVFSAFISTVRSAGLWATLSHQDLGQLRRIEGMDKDAFVANVRANTMGLKVFFKMTSPQDAEEVAKTLGSHREVARTKQVRTGLLYHKDLGIGSERQVWEYNIHPEKLKNLRPFTAAVLADGQKSTLITTPRLFEVLRDPGTGWAPPSRQSSRKALDLGSHLRQGDESKNGSKSGPRNRPHRGS